MADQKISQLTELTAVPADNDYLPILDTSAGETKKIAASYILPQTSSWIPSVAYYGGTTNPTSWVFSAGYSKIGRLVTINLMAYLTLGSGDRTITYFSLPFEADQLHTPATCLESVSSSTTKNCVAYCDETTRIAVVHGTMAYAGKIQIMMSYIAKVG